MEFIAVQGCTFTILGVTPGMATILTPPAIDFKADNKGVYYGTVTVQLTGCSNGSYQQSSPATGTFLRYGQKMKTAVRSF